MRSILPRLAPRKSSSIADSRKSNPSGNLKFYRHFIGRLSAPHHQHHPTSPDQIIKTLIGHFRLQDIHARRRTSSSPRSVLAHQCLYQSSTSPDRTITGQNRTVCNSGDTYLLRPFGVLTNSLLLISLLTSRLRPNRCLGRQI